MKRILIAGLILAVSSFISGCEQQQQEQAQAPASAPIPAPAKKPNILIIVGDDMGYSDIGSFGGEIAQGLQRE